MINGPIFKPGCRRRAERDMEFKVNGEADGEIVAGNCIIHE